VCGFLAFPPEAGSPLRYDRRQAFPLEAGSSLRRDRRQAGFFDFGVFFLLGLLDGQGVSLFAVCGSLNET
jgi:hypothetical protein